LRRKLVTAIIKRKNTQNIVINKSITLQLTMFAEYQLKFHRKTSRLPLYTVYLYRFTTIT